MVGVIDIDENKEILFGYEFTIEDIVWMEPQPKLAELSENIGVAQSEPIDKLKKYLKAKNNKKIKINFLPTYRGDQTLKLADLLGENPYKLKSKHSKKLIEASSLTFY